MMLEKVEQKETNKFARTISGANELLIALWAVTLVAACVCILNYDYRPGAAAHAAPASIAVPGFELKPVAGKPTLMFFAHPKCPCTRASVEELSKIMMCCPDIVGYGVVVIPSGVGADFGQGEIVESLRRIPNLTVVEDTGSVIADQFGASTSGQTIFYDRNGKLVFNGGITFARGHIGDNAGRTKIVSMAKGNAETCHAMQSNPVFGCGLKGETYELSDSRK